MHILVVSRVSIPAKDRTLPAWEYLRGLGHTVTVEHPDSVPASERPDALISMGVSIMDETFRALDRFPGVPLFAYNWDIYEWIWEPGQGVKVQAKHPSRQGEYDYVRYGELLKQASEVWVPSVCTGRRTTQWYGLSNWHVILSACPWWDWPEHDIRDDGYALCTLREIPDPWWGKFEQACTELGIPYRCTRHEVSYREYQEAVAHCRFLCAPLYELSTGGLSLMEGYYHGKPVLLSDSEWNGARDYMGDRATYFRHGDFSDFKDKLLRMFSDPPHLSAPRCRQWITDNFSDRRMVEDMLGRIQATCTAR